MIATPGAVYRSTTPTEHLKVVTRNQERRSAAVSAMDALVASTLPGVEGAEAWGSVFDSGACGMRGFRVPSRDSVEPLGGVPDGLRWDSQARRGVHVLVPAKKTPAGRVMDSTMRALRFEPESLGAVSQILVISNGAADYFASAVIEVIDEEVYATYHLPLRDGPRDRGRVEADAAWEPVSLSAFYAARESVAASTTETVTA